MNKLLLIAAVALGSAFITQDASALCLGYDRTISIPSAWAGRTTVIGRQGTGAGAKIYAYTLNPNNQNQCTGTLIQTGTSITECLRLYGTSGDDFITFINTQTTAYCGGTIYPVGFWGGILDIYGGFGNDFIIGGAGDTLVNGGSGNDAVYASSYPSSSVSGDYGNDKVDGNGNTSSYIYGADGNDRVCTAFTNNAVRVNTLSGGAGTDKYCGSAVNESSLDARDCSACTLF